VTAGSNFNGNGTGQAPPGANGFDVTGTGAVRITDGLFDGNFRMGLYTGPTQTGALTVTGTEFKGHNNTGASVGRIQLESTGATVILDAVKFVQQHGGPGDVQ
jgi:hypothetical protein